MKPSPGGATCHPLLSPLRHCFAVILSPEALRVKCVDGSNGSRAVTWPMTSQFLICISRDLSMEAAILFCCHVVLRWYSHQEALLQRHSSSHVTLLRSYCWWPLYGGCHLVLVPCCFAMIPSPGALRVKVKCVDGSDGSRAVTWFTTSQLFICISRDLSMEVAILFRCHVVLRWYRHQEAMLRVKCVDGSDGSRAVVRDATGQGQKSVASVLICRESYDVTSSSVNTIVS